MRIISGSFKGKLVKLYCFKLIFWVGSFGIECLIRKGKKIVFNEKYNCVLTILKKNLKNLQLIENYLIIEKDIYNSDVFLKLEDKFDIIFLDPPYRNKNLDKVLIDINKQKILKKNGIIIIHRHKNEQDTLPKNFEIINEKKYGISKIIFLTNLS